MPPYDLQLQSGYSQPSTIALFQQKQTPEEIQAQDSKDMKKGALQAAQSSAASGGGLGGMMTSGGLSAGLMGAGPVGWGVMGGGIILSELERSQKEKASREQASIDNEMNRRQNLIQLARDAGNQDFRIA